MFFNNDIKADYVGDSKLKGSEWLSVQYSPSEQNCKQAYNKDIGFIGGNAIALIPSIDSSLN